MKNTLKYYGGMRVRKVYDGSIRKIGQENKSITLKINKDDAAKMIHLLSEYVIGNLESDCYITAYKRQTNANGTRLTFTAPK